MSIFYLVKKSFNIKCVMCEKWLVHCTFRKGFFLVSIFHWVKLANSESTQSEIKSFTFSQSLRRKRCPRINSDFAFFEQLNHLRTNTNIKKRGKKLKLQPSILSPRCGVGSQKSFFHKLALLSWLHSFHQLDKNWNGDDSVLQAGVIFYMRPLTCRCKPKKNLAKSGNVLKDICSDDRNQNIRL